MGDGESPALTGVTCTLCCPCAAHPTMILAERMWSLPAHPPVLFAALVLLRHSPQVSKRPDVPHVVQRLLHPAPLTSGPPHHHNLPALRQLDGRRRLTAAATAAAIYVSVSLAGIFAALAGLFLVLFLGLAGEFGVHEELEQLVKVQVSAIALLSCELNVGLLFQSLVIVLSLRVT